MKLMGRIAAVFLLLLLAASMSADAEIHPTVRIKDLADVEGVRSNQLVGGVGVLGNGEPVLLLEPDSLEGTLPAAQPA